MLGFRVLEQRAELKGTWKMTWKQGGACDRDMGDCQNYGPFLGPYYSTGPNTGPNLGDPKRDHNFDNDPYVGFRFYSGRAGCFIAVNPIP